MSSSTKAESLYKERGRQSRRREDNMAPQSIASLRNLQVIKLIRKFLPTTVNGAGRDTIVQRTLEKHPNVFPNDIKDTKSLSKKVLCDYIKHYISDFLVDSPKEPIHMTFDLRLEPDFPFDLHTLKIDLCVPVGRQAPLIMVLSPEIPRGFALSIERGFRSITDIASRKKTHTKEIKLVLGIGLLSQLLTLLKYLDGFLQQEKRTEIRVDMSKEKKDRAGEKSSAIKESMSNLLISPKATTARKKVAQPIPLHSGSELIERNRQISELQHKLDANVKLFKKTSQVSQFKIFLPVSTNQLDIPALWIYNKGIEIMMNVPAVWPPASGVPIESDTLKICFSNNFHNNTLIKYRKETNAEIDLVVAAKDYRVLELTFLQNLHQLNFPISCLLGIVNTIKNHLGVLSQPQDVFSEWQKSLIDFKALQVE